MIRRDGGEVRVRGRRNGSGHDRRQRTMVRHRRSTKDETGKQSTFLSRLASSRLVLTTSMAVALGAPTPASPQNEYFNLVKVAPSPLVPRSSPQVLLNQRQRHIFTLATFAAYLSLLTLVFDPTALPGQSDPAPPPSRANPRARLARKLPPGAVVHSPRLSRVPSAVRPPQAVPQQSVILSWRATRLHASNSRTSFVPHKDPTFPLPLSFFLPHHFPRLSPLFDPAPLGLYWDCKLDVCASEIGSILSSSGVRLDLMRWMSGTDGRIDER